MRAGAQREVERPERARTRRGPLPFGRQRLPPAAAGADAPDPRRVALDRSARVERVAGAQRALDVSPRVAVQARRADSLSTLPRAGVVQRQVFVSGDLRDNPAVLAVRQSSLFRELNASPFNVAIVQGDGPTDVTVRTDFNAADFDARVPPDLAGAGIQFLVTLNAAAVGGGGIDVDAQRHLATGFAAPRAGAPAFTPEQARAARERAERARGSVEVLRSLPSETRSSLYEYELLRDPLRRGIFANPTPSLFLEDVDYLAFLDPARLTGIAPYFADAPGVLPPAEALGGVDDDDDLRPLIEAAEPPAGTGRLSLYTVLLHELGHVRQQLATRRIFNTGRDVVDLREDTPPPVPARLQALTEAALEEGALSAPVWRELLDLKNVMQKWLPVVRDFFEGRGRAALATRAVRADALGDQIAARAQVWLEYDVITNVEHPAALERGEAVRHLHGVEQTVTPGRGAETLAALAERTTGGPLEGPRELQRVMIGNAQRLTADLPAILAEYLAILAELCAGVGGGGR